MAVKLRRPILVGGLGLSLGIWLLDSLHPLPLGGGGVPVWGAIALGSGWWWLSQRGRQAGEKALLPSSPVSREQVERTLAEVERLIQQFVAELPPTTITDPAGPIAVAAWRQQLALLAAETDRQNLRLVVAGGKAVGKTALFQLLRTQWRPQATPIGSASLPRHVEIKVVPEISPGDGAGLAMANLIDLQAADVVVFVTTGDVTEPEFQQVTQLLGQRQRVVLAFNKQDQYLPSDRPAVLQQLRERLRDQVPDVDIVAIATVPGPVKVRQYQPDGSLQERVEQPDPDIAALMQQLDRIVAQDGAQLVLETVLRQVEGLRATVQAGLNQMRRDRAMPLVEQYQWIAAASAFASPVPSLDLLATAAINGQLILDLGAIYQQTFSLQQAKTIAGTLAGVMVKLGLVELSTQAIAPLLKSNALTFVAGGALQGVSAAYLTRIAGIGLMEYFQEQSQMASANAALQPEKLAQKLQAVFQQNQQAAFLQTLVRQAMSRLTITDGAFGSSLTASPTVPSAALAGSSAGAISLAPQPLAFGYAESARIGENRSDSGLSTAP